MTELQELAAAVRIVTDEFRHVGAGHCRPCINKLEDLLDAHADDPAWFPVKFEVGDWVCNGHIWGYVILHDGALAIHESDGKRSLLDGFPTPCRSLPDDELASRIRELNDKTLADFTRSASGAITKIREHFKP